MEAISWDRLMHTCVKQDSSEILFIPGYPPMMRMGGGLATLQVPAVTTDDILRMLGELKRPPAVAKGAADYEYKEHDGYQYMDIAYRDGHAFRVVAFGRPHPSLMILIRLRLEENETRGHPE